MSNLVKFKKKKVEFDYYKSYFNSYVNVLQETIQYMQKNSTDNIDKKFLQKLLFTGVRMFNNKSPHNTLEEAELLIKQYTTIKLFISKMTPNEIMKVFPIDKEYNGKKYGCKDYFYTTKFINEIGEDNEIGDNVDKFMWSYWNKELFDFDMKAFNAMNDVYKLQTGKGIMEKFVEEQGIPTYTLRKNAKGEEILVQNKLPKKKDYLQIVK